MGVVDEGMRQERVQQRLDRRIGRGRIDQVGALQRHHVLVAEAVQLARLQQRRELHRRQARRLDHRHVPAAALDAEHVPGVADEVGDFHLHRRVAPAMQHQARLAAKETGGVDAQREFAVETAFGVVAASATYHFRPHGERDGERLRRPQDPPTRERIALRPRSRSPGTTASAPAVCRSRQGTTRSTTSPT